MRTRATRVGVRPECRRLGRLVMSAIPIIVPQISTADTGYTASCHPKRHIQHYRPKPAYRDLLGEGHFCCRSCQVRFPVHCYSLHPDT